MIDFDKEKLGTLFQHKETGEIYQLRQFPIIKNHNEKRIRYLLDQKTNNIYIREPDPSQYDLYSRCDTKAPRKKNKTRKKR